MTAEISTLVVAAASIGFFHTLLGPDHYLPFIMMSWARKWSTLKTTLITLACGLGHILSSIVLGMVGVMIGIGVNKLELVESTRGNLAAWLLIAFGLAYFAWGLRQAYRNKPHTHIHNHTDNVEHPHPHDHGDQPKHQHPHTHDTQHVHIHDQGAAHSLAPWTLFVIFIFGPCEPLIPVLMYPAAKQNFAGLILVTGVFAVVTLSTMLGVVLAARAGANFMPLEKLSRYAHPIAGATILICGLAILLFGL